MDRGKRMLFSRGWAPVQVRLQALREFKRAILVDQDLTGLFGERILLQ